MDVTVCESHKLHKYTKFSRTPSRRTGDSTAAHSSQNLAFEDLPDHPTTGSNHERLTALGSNDRLAGIRQVKHYESVSSAK